MLTINIAIAIKILIYTMLALYFTGNYWLCFSLIFFTWNKFEDVDNYFIASQLSLPYGQKFLQCFYYALTTLSTVGFGDFYPVSDFERILGAFMILFGVALFSIIISEFLEMIAEIQAIKNQQLDDEELEIFFVTIAYFNNKKTLNQSFVDEITDFFKYKWEYDKNNFMETEEDEKILKHLTIKKENTVVELYTKFIYRNFLKRFNRFFMIKKEDVPTGPIGSIYLLYGSKTFKQLLR